MELSNLKLKKLLIFQEELPKLEKSKILYLFFVERELFKYKNKRKMKKNHSEKCLIFREIEVSNLKLKKLLIFQEELPKTEKSKISYFLFVVRELAKYKHTKNVLILFLLKK